MIAPDDATTEQAWWLHFLALLCAELLWYYISELYKRVKVRLGVRLVLGTPCFLYKLALQVRRLA
jgi:hypothetical protein